VLKKSSQRHPERNEACLPQAGICRSQKWGKSRFLGQRQPSE
jgi:hypothetical protein